jgi:membrane AbrB-like protein
MAGSEPSNDGITFQKSTVRLAAALSIGGAGGALFAYLQLPLPWLLGALAATTIASMAGLQMAVPDRLRQPMIAVLGLMLGTTFTPERVEAAVSWLPTLGALPFYVVVVGAAIWLYLWRFSGFDQATTFFAATPGGLSEMVALSAQLGGDQRAVSLIHGTRVLLIVLTIPFLASLYQQPAQAAPPALDLLAIAWGPLLALFGFGLFGYLIAARLRLPAATFVGPLLGSAIAHGTGVIAVQPPYLLMAVAQLVIGTSVGVRFCGFGAARLAGAMLLGAGGTLLMLLITLAFGGALHQLTGQPLALLLLAFIPGGLVEMSLIALGLGADPAFVVTHHATRIFLVVLIALPVAAWLRRSGRLGAPDARPPP